VPLQFRCGALSVQIFEQAEDEVSSTRNSRCYRWRAGFAKSQHVLGLDSYDQDIIVIGQRHAVLPAQGQRPLQGEIVRGARMHRAAAVNALISTAVPGNGVPRATSPDPEGLPERKTANVTRQTIRGLDRVDQDDALMAGQQFEQTQAAHAGFSKSGSVNQVTLRFQARCHGSCHMNADPIIGQDGVAKAEHEGAWVGVRHGGESLSSRRF
jgi:hypothetical protein